MARGESQPISKVVEAFQDGDGMCSVYKILISLKLIKKHVILGESSPQVNDILQQYRKRSNILLQTY